MRDRACPPEDCGDPWEFMAQKQEHSVRYIASRCSEIMDEGDIPGNIEEMYELRQWLMVDHFEGIGSTRSQDGVTSD